MPRLAAVTRISIVEDHELFAETLDLALTLEGHRVQRVQVRDHAGPSERLLPLVLRQRPQVVVLDLDLGAAGDGMPLIGPLDQAGMAVLVVSASTDHARLGECLLLGARAVLSKTEPLNRVLAGIRCIANDQPAMSRAEREGMLLSYEQEHRYHREMRGRLDSLSLRESEVLVSLMSGRSVHDIARRWCVSEATVRTQVKAIRSKLGVHSQLAAVAAALRVRWTPPAARA